MKAKVMDQANQVETALRLRDHLQGCPACRSYVKGGRHSLCHEGTILLRRRSGEDT